jgi:hypothetical protein
MQQRWGDKQLMINTAVMTVGVTLPRHKSRGCFVDTELERRMG